MKAERHCYLTKQYELSRHKQSHELLEWLRSLAIQSLQTPGCPITFGGQVGWTFDPCNMETVWTHIIQHVLKSFQCVYTVYIYTYMYAFVEWTLTGSIGQMSFSDPMVEQIVEWRNGSMSGVFSFTWRWLSDFRATLVIFFLKQQTQAQIIRVSLLSFPD